ncbi:MAG: glycogen debranching protein GlgX, partial [Alphaproteobacteria bacterium]|nr:glycogen debranching protein GlgX [Alphaproteobacteria bacterium]
MKEFKQSIGKPYPLGSTVEGKGVNFALFSANAEKVELCLFDKKGKKEIARIEIKENTAGIWHVYVEGVTAGQIYGYRVYGPYKPLEGKRFNPHKLLIDPYAKQLTGRLIWHKAIFGYDIDSPNQDLSFSTLDSAPYVPKSVVTMVDTFDWTGDIKPNVKPEKTVVYELHPKGYTALFPKAPDENKGKFEALCSKEIQTYLKWLGVTTVELMPVHAFFGHQEGRGRTNYWGYETLSFFALENTYLKNDCLDDFKKMVKTFHKSGKEVILDVVYNHTIEGNHLGPTLCWRGIDNESYYTLNKTNKRFYFDTTGCGANFNVENRYVLRLVTDSLRYFADQMHVDGFRFDLAATLGREKTEFKYDNAFFKVLLQDESLRGLKLIAEPWDIGPNGYQIGAFGAGIFEWNDRFRDVVRRFWRGDNRQVGELASRLAGSSDIFGYHNRNLWTSINFITAHDGFCLYDLVSFDKKHNAANGENNQDGTNDNWSSNGGVEGLIASKDVIEKRLRRAKNMVATLLFSFGTPMITAGDEFLKTQFGNNNPYAQDNVLSYIVWDGISKQGY